ncbi:MAG: hypothetical protein J0I47_09265 [Sphingomonas sp.]|uniref:hypothetical protein n=1 Tax=Sphingomonas sp. TaxID=28214 RepID=UPI001AC1CC90|nr:hypothetical protein [Sphingomonas sp.]MBN8808408.1 hypothetical protein [Sphingomonas sp.]
MLNRGGISLFAIVISIYVDSISIRSQDCGAWKVKVHESRQEEALEKGKSDAVHQLVADVARKAGVEPAAAEKVLRALNIDSHINEVAGLTRGPIDATKVKLAYRLSSGGIIA